MHLTSDWSSPAPSSNAVAFKHILKNAGECLDELAVQLAMESLGGKPLSQKGSSGKWSHTGPVWRRAGALRHSGRYFGVPADRRKPNWCRAEHRVE